MLERATTSPVAQQEEDAILPADESLDSWLGSMLGAHSERMGVHLQLYRYKIERDGRLAAGIFAWAMGSDVHIDLLAVDKPFRHNGFGSRLLAHVEDQAHRDGCVTASVNTFSFQAPEFYPAHGYNEIFRYQLANGTEHLFFSKRL